MPEIVKEEIKAAEAPVASDDKRIEKFVEKVADMLVESKKETAETIKKEFEKKDSEIKELKDANIKLETSLAEISTKNISSARTSDSALRDLGFKYRKEMNKWLKKPGSAVDKQIIQDVALELAKKDVGALSTTEELATKSLERLSDSSLPMFDVKTLTSGDDTSLGYFTKPAISSELVRKPLGQLGFADLITTKTVSGSDLEIPISPKKLTAQKTAELEEATVQDLEGQIYTLHTGDVDVKVACSRRFLTDANFDVYGYINAETADGYTNAREELYLNHDGKGANTTKGLFQDQRLDVVTVTATTVELLYNIQEAFFSLPPSLRPGAKVIMNSRTFASLNRAVDTNQRPLYQDFYSFLKDGPVFTVGGLPVIITDTAPDMYTPAHAPISGASGIIVGNPQEYWEIQESNVTYLQNPYRNDKIIYTTVSKRMGGGVRNFWTFKKLKFA
jgi:HK97 family phage major capsid protein